METSEIYWSLSILCDLIRPAPQPLLWGQVSEADPSARKPWLSNYVSGLAGESELTRRLLGLQVRGTCPAPSRPPRPGQEAREDRLPLG